MVYILTSLGCFYLIACEVIISGLLIHIQRVKIAIYAELVNNLCRKNVLTRFCCALFLLCSVHPGLEISMSSKSSTVEDQTTVEDISF